MRKKKRNWYSLDYFSYRKRFNFNLTIALLFASLVLLIAGFILLNNVSDTALTLFISSGIWGLLALIPLSGYFKFRRIIKRVLNSLSKEEKNDVSFLMSIDCRDYLKKDKEEEDDEDFE